MPLRDNLAALLRVVSSGLAAAVGLVDQAGEVSVAGRRGIRQGREGSSLVVGRGVVFHCTHRDRAHRKGGRGGGYPIRSFRIVGAESDP